MKVAGHPAVLVSIGLSMGAGCATNTATDGGSQDAGPGDAGVDAGPVDGGPDAGPDLSCLGLSLPTTAPATLALGGTVVTTSLTGTSPVAGATVELFASSGGSALATATSNATGAFSFSVSSGGVPLDGYLHVSAATYTDTYWYPAVPFAMNSSTLPVAMLTPGTLSALRSFANAAQPAGAGMAGLEVVDCAGSPLSGAIVTSNPAAGNTTYIVGNVPSTSATSTDASGAAFLFDITAGTVTLGGTLGSTSLRSHQVNARPDVVTETSVQP